MGLDIFLRETLAELKTAFYWRGFWEGFAVASGVVSTLFAVASAIGQRRGR